MIPFVQFEKIQIGPLAIYIWGLFLALGILVTLIYSLKEGKKRNIDQNLIADSFVWLIIGLIIGARLGHVLLYAGHYSLKPIDIFKIWQGGMTFHGGLIGLLLAGIIFAKVKKLNWKTFFKVADVIALAGVLGIAVGRIGCLLINDHQGSETSLPWGIVWPDGTIRHPVAGYLILANLLIFFVLLCLKSSFMQKEGKTFFSFLLLYSLSRFLLDFTRSVGEPLSDLRHFYLSTAQWLSLAVILAIIIKRLLKGRFINRRKDNEES